MAKRTRKPERTYITYSLLVKELSKDRFLRGRKFAYLEVRHITDLLVSLMEQHLVENEEIRIPGFGTFYRIFVPPRKIRHPQTKQIIIVEGRHEIRFRPGARILIRMGANIKCYKYYADKKVLKERGQVRLQHFLDKEAGKKKGKYNNLETDF